MRYRELKMAIALLIVCTGGTLAVGQSSAPPPGQPTINWSAPHASDILLVGFHEGVSSSARDSVHAAVGMSKVRSFHLIPLDVVRVPAHTNLQSMAATYAARSEVAYVQPSYRYEAIAVPNDPYFSQQWGLNNTGQTGGTPDADIDAPEAWNIRTSAQDIVVGVIDTGIDYNHEDLAANMWTNQPELYGVPGEDDDENGIVDDIYGARWTNGNGTPTSGDPWDDFGHGTHVAGIIGAVGNNGTGIAGVCWSVKLMALKFLDSGGGGWTPDAVAAIEYAVDKGADLTNNSWGGGPYDQALKDAIQAAGESGQLFVAAAGNGKNDNDTNPVYPCSYDLPWIISVAATDHNDVLADFPDWGSNYGRRSVDLAAPGVDIYSTVPGNNYESHGGTSMASPHVAGSCALCWAYRPTASSWQIKAWVLGGVDKKNFGTKHLVTDGRLNLYNTLQCPNFVWTIKAANLYNVAAADTLGNLFITGFYEEQTAASPDALTLWQLKNSSGIAKVWIRHDSTKYGDQTTLFLKGTVKSSLSQITNQTFVIKDTSGNKILVADAQSGDLWVQKTVAIGTGGF